MPINKREHAQSSGYYAVVIRNMKGNTTKLTDKRDGVIGSVNEIV